MIKDAAPQPSSAKEKLANAQKKQQQKPVFIRNLTSANQSELRLVK